MVVELLYQESGEANSHGAADFIGWKTVRDVRQPIVPTSMTQISNRDSGN